MHGENEIDDGPSRASGVSGNEKSLPLFMVLTALFSLFLLGCAADSAPSQDALFVPADPSAVIVDVSSHNLSGNFSFSEDLPSLSDDAGASGVIASGIYGIASNITPVDLGVDDTLLNESPRADEAADAEEKMDVMDVPDVVDTSAGAASFYFGGGRHMLPLDGQLTIKSGSTTTLNVTLLFVGEDGKGDEIAMFRVGDKTVTLKEDEDVRIDGIYLFLQDVMLGKPRR